MEYSAEQKNVISLCSSDKNVIVDAVAGSGKTTTLLGIAEANSDKLMLGVLYNRSLKEETRVKAAAAGHINLEIHNYHALARKYYDETCCNDSGITNILVRNQRPIRKLRKWSRIVLDEVQDMSPIYYRFILKLIIDLDNPMLRLTVMGDHLQAIYSYMQADYRFLTHAASLFKPVQGEWAQATLSTTYRCSAPICSFINEALLGYERMIPAKKEDAPKVHYIHSDPFKAYKPVVNYITTLLTPHYGYKPEDVFILAPSVKVKGKSTPTRILENALVERGIPVYVPNDDETEVSTSAESPTNGKLVLTTYHQSKGLERAIVVVYNFDDSYFDYRDEYDSSRLCPPLYVALTRAKKFLFVVADVKKPALKFYTEPKSECVVYLNSNGQVLSGLHANSMKPSVNIAPRSRVFMASELTDYLPAETLVKARGYLTVETVRQPINPIPLVSTIQTGPTTFEAVSDLNGVAIPALFEWQHKRAMRISSLPSDLVTREAGPYAARYQAIQKRVANSSEEPDIESVLEAANLFNTILSGYHYKAAQITDYSWLSREAVEPCLDILRKELGNDDVQYEVEMPEIVFKGTTIRGRTDAYSEKASNLWEIKCTENLDVVHEIQTAVYAWMFLQGFPKRFQNITFRLLNIKTGEIRRIHASGSNLNEMMSFLIEEKTSKPTKRTDEEFIKEFTTNIDLPTRTQVQLTIPQMVDIVKPMFLDDDDDSTAAIVSKKATNIISTTPPRNTTQTHLPFASTVSTAVVEPIDTAPLGRVIVFDLETNGLPQTAGYGKYHPPSDTAKYNGSRIVQWSWAKYEPDGTLVSEEDHIIQPNLAEYRIMNQQFHGITEQKARVQGKPFVDILNIWTEALKDVDMIVGHNVSFDKHVLLSELHRRGFTAAADELEKKTWLCTMERAKTLCGLKASNKLKPPKLRELMHALAIPEEPGRAFHNSKHDVYYTGRCFFAEQVLKNPCPKMYEGKHAGKTYEEILNCDRLYAVHAHASCNIHKLYDSPLRKLSNWMKDKIAKDSTLAAEVKDKEDEIRSQNPT